MHPSCKQSPRSEGKTWMTFFGTRGKIEEEIWWCSGELKAFAWINSAFLDLPSTETQLLLPAVDRPICNGGLLVTKAGYTAGEIRSSRVRNCQRGLQGFIFFMLNVAWEQLMFKTKHSPPALKWTKQPAVCLVFFSCHSSINYFSNKVFLKMCVSRLPLCQCFIWTPYVICQRSENELEMTLSYTNV